MKPPINTRTGRPLREVIGVFAGPKQGKSTSWVTIADYEHRTGSKSRFFVIDTDGDAAERLLASRPHLDRVRVLRAANWEQFKMAAKMVRVDGVDADGDFADPAGEGDWIVVDLADRVWKFVQNYYCLAPETRVLTDDLRWVAVGELQLGDGLAAFDEHGTVGKRRKWRKGEVVSTGRIRRPCYMLTFDNGTEVVASDEHPWLVARGGSNTTWCTTAQLRVASGGRAGSRVIRLIEPWEEDNSRDAGYLAAAFDGEGFLTKREYANGWDWNLGFSQKENLMLAAVTDALKQKGIRFTEHVNTATGVCTVSIGHQADRLKFLGQFRPERLMPKFEIANGSTLMPLDELRLVKKEFIGDMEVVALGTSTHTFIAEGMATHNTRKVHQRDDEDEAEYLLHLRAQWEGTGKGQPKRSTTEGWDWGFVNGLYDATFLPLLLETNSHVFITTEQADYSPDLEQDKAKRMMFGKAGVKMTGQKSLPYQVSTILHIDTMAGKRVLTTIGDRDGVSGPRPYLDKANMDDFVQGYLLDPAPAGWQLS